VSHRKHHLLTARFYFLLTIILLAQAFQVIAQFTPVLLNGFSQDVIAEAGPNPWATTTMPIDATVPPGGNNKVLYSAAFAGFASIAGGLPDNGTITNAGDNYQLASYTGNNALFVKRNETFELTVTTPGSYVKIRLLAFSAEGPSTINVGLGFSDGSFSPYLTNYVLANWFWGTTNIVSQGFGRVTRTATGPFVADGVTENNPVFIS